MKSRDALVRAASFDLAEKRRKLNDIDSIAEEFRRMAADLEQQIEAEHIRTNIRDVMHFAYSSFAKAARKRRDNLMVSATDLLAKRDAAAADVATAEAELKRLEAASDRASEDRESGRRRSSRARQGSLITPPRAP